MFFSMYHGGITPACGPMPVRCLIARAHGRDLFIGGERHRAGAVRPMAVLAAALQDRRDVFRVGDLTIARSTLRLKGRGGETARDQRAHRNSPDRDCPPGPSFKLHVESLLGICRTGPLGTSRDPM